jgi:hypothetical protein
LTTLSFEAAARRVRERYVAYFRACIADLEREGRVQAECEVLNEDGEVVLEGPLELGYRYDAALITEGQAETFTFESTTLESFEPFSEALGGLTVKVQPFHWDDCEVTIEPALGVGALEPFGDWFRRWFRANAEPVEGTVGAIHFGSDPEVGPNATRIVVDFGTAPVAALVSLLGALGGCGAERVSIAAGGAA